MARGGFTLLEMMLALVLFAVGTIAVMDLLHRAQIGSSDGENARLATSLARRRLEELRNVAYGSLANEAKARLASPWDRFCREATVTTPSTNLRQVTVTVSWDPPDCTTNSSNPYVVLQTYRSGV